MKKFFGFIILMTIIITVNVFLWDPFHDFAEKPLNERIESDGAHADQVTWERENGSENINAIAVTEGEYDGQFWDQDVMEDIYEKYIDYLELTQDYYGQADMYSDEEKQAAFNAFKEVAEPHIDMYTSDYGHNKIREEFTTFIEIPTPDYIENVGVTTFDMHQDMHQYDDHENKNNSIVEYK